MFREGNPTLPLSSHAIRITHYALRITYHVPLAPQKLLQRQRTSARFCPRQDVTYRFAVLDSNILNAFAAPGGYIFITKGLLLSLKDEAELAELCLASIVEVIPDARARYLGYNVLRTPIAYPVFLNKYEQARQNFERSTNIENLLSIGRNGEFSHIFMEDVYWRTRKKVQKLIETVYS